MTPSRIGLIVSAAALAVLLAVGGWWYRTQQRAIPMPCADPRAGCMVPGGGTLRFVGEPNPMVPFEVRLTDRNADQVSIRFAMDGMEMGPAESPLQAGKPKGGSVAWAGRSVLPICVQGRHDWVALLSIDGTHYRVTFRTLK